MKSPAANTRRNDFRSSAWLTPYLREATAPDEVVLAPTDASIQLVGPAGRKVVALHPIFSNPYVDSTTRMQDQRAMLDALRAGDAERFHSIGRRYQIRQVVASKDADCDSLNHAPLVLTKRQGHACLFTVAPVKDSQLLHPATQRVRVQPED